MFHQFAKNSQGVITLCLLREPNRWDPGLRHESTTSRSYCSLSFAACGIRADRNADAADVQRNWDPGLGPKPAGRGWPGLQCLLLLLVLLLQLFLVNWELLIKVLIGRSLWVQPVYDISSKWGLPMLVCSLGCPQNLCGLGGHWTPDTDPHPPPPPSLFPTY